MELFTYKYSITNDFPYQRVNPTDLGIEIGNSNITHALDHIGTDGDDCNIVFKGQLHVEDYDDTTGLLTIIVKSHNGHPDTEPVAPTMDDGRPIVRADSRPFGFQTYYTMAGDDSTAGIGYGQEMVWDFSNSDNIVTGDHVQTGMKCKEFMLTFLCPVYTKDGALYFFDAPWGCYLMMDIAIPPGQWYPNPAGPVTGEQLGMVGDTSKYANTGTEWVSHTSYLMRYRIHGSCPMGDELNAEGSAVNPIPIGWAVRGRIYTPDTDNVSKGFAELEMHRCHAGLLPGQTLADLAAAHGSM